MMRGIGESNTGRWIKYYSSGHSILLVGEGDFSFSLCLGMAFGSATNIFATSLDSYDVLMTKYKDAEENVAMLTALGASVLFGVDATQMKNLPDLWWRKFDRIIFNFPHAGFHGKEDNPNLITMHRNLVRGFLQNASSMLWLNGEIHINHKTSAPFDSWKIEDLASECSLTCTGQYNFRSKDYPWYCNKRGSGWKPDESFPLGACKTFKFKLNPAAAEVNRALPPDQTFAPSAINPFALCDVDSSSPALPLDQMFAPSPMAIDTFAICNVDSSINGLAAHGYTSECHMLFEGSLGGTTSFDICPQNVLLKTL